MPTLWWLIGEGEAEVSEEDHWSPPLEGLRVRALSKQEKSEIFSSLPRGGTRGGQGAGKARKVVEV